MLVHIWNEYIKDNDVNKYIVINKIKQQFIDSPYTAFEAIKLIDGLSYYHTIMTPNNCIIIRGTNCKIRIVLT